MGKDYRDLLNFIFIQKILVTKVDLFYFIFKRKKLAFLGQIYVAFKIQNHDFPQLQLLDSKSVISTSETQKYFAAFSASHPTIPTESLSAITALSRYCLLLEVRAIMANDKQNELFAGENWNPVLKTQGKQTIPLSDRVFNNTPHCSTLENWVRQLAIDQALVTSNELTKAQAVTLQEDGAPDGTSVQLLNWFSTTPREKKARDGSVKSFLCGVSKTGEKANAIAEGVEHTLKKTFALPPTFQLFTVTVYSGGGTPESLFNALGNRNLVRKDGSGLSCIEHDNMSCFCLPLNHYIGQGGLGN